jgi:signal peptidase I
MKWLKPILWVVGILAAICLILYLTVFDVWTLPSDDKWHAASVEPTLAAGDVLVLSRHGTPDRGHLVRCPDPRVPGRFVIGRFIAKEREKVEFAAEVPSVDGSRTPSRRGCDPVTLKHPETGDDVEHACSVEEISQNAFQALRAKNRPEANSKHEVQLGKVFLISDNRHIHDDSRDYGHIEIAQCQHVLFRLWGGQGFGDAKRRFTVIW